MPAVEVADEPTIYLNPGAENGDPFAVLALGPGLTLYIHEAVHARAIAAAFAKAAELLETQAGATDPAAEWDKPLPPGAVQ